MANYTIRLTILEEDRKRLRKIIGQRISLFRDEKVGGFFRNIKISNCNMSCYLKNNPSLQQDGEEYPQIIVGGSAKENVQWEHLLSEKVISISIIRDEVTWAFKDDRWDLCSDVGIKFNFQDQEKDIFLMAVDSLAGFMELKRDILQEDQSEYWSLKSDEFKTASRRVCYLRGLEGTI